jgi:hypothetical protein
MRASLVLVVWLAAAVLLEAQAPLGSLLYADPVGRGIRLVVVAGGLPDRMSLRPEQGDEGRLRNTVLTLAGPERFQVSAVQVLVDRAPGAWRVAQRSGGALLRVGETTYWRYLPGQVLPVRLAFQGRIWTLQSADLPPRRF